MIIQGTNNPIYLYFPQPPADIHVTLLNEIEILKQWEYDDLHRVNEMHYTAPITQDESMNWEEGRCWIEVKWNVSAESESSDISGVVQFGKCQDWIVPWTDKALMTDTTDVPEVTG